MLNLRLREAFVFFLAVVDKNLSYCCDSRSYCMQYFYATSRPLNKKSVRCHQVVRQQNSGVAEDFILPHSAVYLRIWMWKKYWNRSTFAKVIVKIKVAPFLWPTVYFMWSCHYRTPIEVFGWTFFLREVCLCSVVFDTFKFHRSRETACYSRPYVSGLWWKRI